MLLYDRDEPRARGDSDLIVRAADFTAAKGVLRAEGFALVLDDVNAPEWERHGSTWRREDPPGVVDLHWTLPGATGKPDAVWAALRRDAVDFPIAGVPVRAPGPGHCALHLALHVAQHGPGDAKAADDLRRGLGRLGRPVWTHAADLAAEIGAVDAFAVGLRSQPVGAAIADEIRLETAGDRVHALRAANAPGGAYGLERLARAAGVRARTRVLAQTLAPPAEFMRYYKPLARRGRLGLAAAYVVRPFDLARQVPPAWRAWRHAR